MQPFDKIGYKFLTLAVIGGVFATLLGLGAWQSKRLEWKENLLATINQRLASAPVSIQDIMILHKNNEDIEYRPVTVSGIFDHDKERHFFATHKGFSGYYVYTPLYFEHNFNNSVVFINRGFIPFDQKQPKTRSEGQIKGPVRINGLARKMLQQKPSLFVPDNQLDSNTFFWKNLKTMASSVAINYEEPSLQKFFIDADDRLNPGGLPLGGVTLTDLPNNHLQYVFTWYGLAGALLLVVSLFIYRQKPFKKPHL